MPSTLIKIQIRFKITGEISHINATFEFSNLRQTAKPSHLLGNWERFINVSKPWVPLEQSAYIFFSLFPSCYLHEKTQTRGRSRGTSSIGPTPERTLILGLDLFDIKRWCQPSHESIWNFLFLRVNVLPDYSKKISCHKMKKEGDSMSVLVNSTIHDLYILTCT